MAWLHFSRTARNLALSAASTWYLGECSMMMMEVLGVGWGVGSGVDNV